MRLLFFTMLLLLTAFTCQEDDLSVTSAERLIFGAYNGFCVGDQCLSLYKLEGGTLYKETSLTNRDLNLPVEGKFDELDDDLYKIAESLIAEFPQRLLDEDKEVYGCPGCHDQTTILVQLETTEKTRFWRLDSDLPAIPKDLQQYVQEIVAVMEKLE